MNHVYMSSELECARQQQLKMNNTYHRREDERELLQENLPQTLFRKGTTIDLELREECGFLRRPVIIAVPLVDVVLRRPRCALNINIADDLI